jgi:hypothetical protein
LFACLSGGVGVRCTHMAFPENHVEKVCLRGGVECPRLGKMIGGGKTEYWCTKSHEDKTSLLDAVFAVEPEIAKAIRVVKDATPQGRCSGPPAYVEYTD